MGKSTIEGRTLGRAAELLGGRSKLAKHLQVPLDTLDAWLAGEQRPLNVYFLRAVDIVLYSDVVEPSGAGEVRPWRQLTKDNPENEPS